MKKKKKKLIAKLIEDQRQENVKFTSVTIIFIPLLRLPFRQVGQQM